MLSKPLSAPLLKALQSIREKGVSGLSLEREQRYPYQTLIRRGLAVEVDHRPFYGFGYYITAAGKAYLLEVTDAE